MYVIYITYNEVLKKVVNYEVPSKIPKDILSLLLTAA